MKQTKPAKKHLKNWRKNLERMELHRDTQFLGSTISNYGDFNNA